MASISQYALSSNEDPQDHQSTTAEFSEDIAQDRTSQRNKPGATCVHTMMGPKTRVRLYDRCATDTTFVEKRQDLDVKEIFVRTCILVHVNRDPGRRSNCQHQHPSPLVLQNTLRSS
jgi:hypothetical protein